MKTLITILITAVLAVVGTLYLKNMAAPSTATGPVKDEARLYQCAMHPWIKSNQPGRCTICGMELTLVSNPSNGITPETGGNVVALTASQIHVINVATVEARIQALSHTLKVAGMIDDDAKRHRLISAYVNGRIDKLYANHHGIEVEAGKPLALVYSPALLQAEREYRQLDGELKRNAGLRLQQMGLTPKQIAELPDKDPEQLTSEILAPLGGTVVEHNVYEGQYVTAGEKLFEIADFSTMWFQFQAYEQDLPWIKNGQTVAITTPSIPGKSFEGQITFIDPNFDEATRSTKVRVELPNPRVDGRRELLHRLYADGWVKVDLPAVLAIPKSAVIQTGPQAVVYIDQGNGGYVQTAVKMGRRGDSLLEITDGLKAGDKIVTNGNLLIDGQAELNRSFMAVGPTTVAEKRPTLTDPQRKAIRDFMKTADAMAATLAADDLAGFNEAAKLAMPAGAALVEVLAGHPGLQALSETRPFQGSTDLPSARSAFLKFSVAATAVLEPLRRWEGFPDLQIWECPMVNEAIPGAPKKVHWIQINGRAGHNPFFGSEMLDCGEEIKP